MESHHLDPKMLQYYSKNDQTSHWQVDVLQAVGFSQSIVSHALAPFLETGSANRRPDNGSLRITMWNEDRNIAITASQIHFLNVCQILNGVQGAICNWLWEVGLTTYDPLRTPTATAHYRQLWRIWCSERLEEHTNWNAVMCNNESNFWLNCESRLHRVYIEHG